MSGPARGNSCKQGRRTFWDTRLRPGLRPIFERREEGKTLPEAKGESGGWPSNIISGTSRRRGFSAPWPGIGLGALRRCERVHMVATAQAHLVLVGLIHARNFQRDTAWEAGAGADLRQPQNGGFRNGPPGGGGGL